MVYSSKDFESLWFLYQAESLPKNISIEKFLDKPSEQVRALEKTRSRLSYFRHMVQKDEFIRYTRPVDQFDRVRITR